MGPGFDYVSPSTFQTGYDVDGYSNVQYHFPGDMLPLGLGVKVGYVPDMNDTTMLSAKDSNSNPGSQATGRNITMIQVSWHQLMVYQSKVQQLKLQILQGLWS